MTDKNEDIMVSKASDQYETKIFGKVSVGRYVHHLSHVIAAGLATPNHLMDWSLSKDKQGIERRAGHQTEPIALMYELFIRHYPNNKYNIQLAGRLIDMDFDKPDEFIDDAIYTSKAISTIQIDRDWENINLIGHLDESASVSHDKARRRLAAGGINSIKYPSKKEMMFHWNKAKELCDKIYEEEGVYPKDVFAKYGGIEKTPLKVFEIDNIYTGAMRIRDDLVDERAASTIRQP
jgi:hypothetical protein